MRALSRFACSVVLGASLLAPVGAAAAPLAAPTTTAVLAVDTSSSDSNSSCRWGLFAAGVALLGAGPTFYIVKWRRYSGAGLRHHYETETESLLSNPQGTDHFQKRVKGASSVTL